MCNTCHRNLFTELRKTYRAAHNGKRMVHDGDIGISEGKTDEEVFTSGGI